MSAVSIDEDTYDLLAKRANQRGEPTERFINDLLKQIADRVEPAVHRDRDSDTHTIEDQLRNLGYVD